MKIFTARTRKAFGLVEVIVAIAISGVIMLGATQVAIRGFRVTRLNELKDITNGIVTQSLELTRSETTLKFNELLTAQPTCTKACNFKLTQDSYTPGNYGSTNTKGLTFVSVAAPDLTNNNYCNINSTNFKITTEQPNYAMYNIIRIERLPETDPLRYNFKVTSKACYFVGNTPYPTDALISYRSELK